jgi:hypothetical protein
MTEAARVWSAAGRGPVIGITPSQSARNTLAAGVPESCNTAQFLGHLPGRRGARGPLAVTGGTLLLVDESSMIPTPDLADLVNLAEARSAKMILAGDTGQLQAVENGGAMSLLAGALGYVRLPAPVRFRAAWEQAASLRLRAGDASVLADYDQHGRIIAGDPEQMTDAAAAAYVALTLDGTDTLLMAAGHSLRRELSRRIRDDLIHPAQAVTAAVAERPLTGARDVPSVIDARLRRRAGPLVPLPPGPWSEQVPGIADPERRAFAAQIAAMMDARKVRIGEHAAEHALPWAVTALGPVPGHPADRLEWQRRAASIGAYRELSGHDDPTEPIGPEPVAGDPGKRALWHEAFAALGPVGGPDVRGLPDGILLHLRDTYPIETAWAPQWAGDELRQVRLGAREARLAAIRADGEQATRQQRRLAVAADAELRRRHPGQRFPPLRSAEPRPATRAQRDELTMTAGEETKETDQRIRDLTAGHQTFAVKLAERQSMTIPSADPGYGDLGQAFPPWNGRRKDAILQPPRPEIRPSARVLERTADRGRGIEAAN